MSSVLPPADNLILRAEQAARAIQKLDGWLQTMNSPTGFGGPISHWWESSLLYCGPMTDWRYEGILSGYTSLFEATGDPMWLQRAEQAAGDVLKAQLATGSFLNSSFQYGPIEGGTPHEAAASGAKVQT